MIHTALVHWLSSADRGRSELPATLRYVGISRFKDDGPDWPNGSWSVELRFDQPPPEQARDDISRGTVRFLFETAPQERLRAGVQFGLYEGLQKVAEVDVVD